jgi:hypothetical protein
MSILQALSTPEWAFLVKSAELERGIYEFTP